MYADHRVTRVMALANLRPFSTAYSLLIGAAPGKEEADRDVKQREWIWEFLLKKCSNGRLLLELLTSLPFPNDNAELKRLLLLRALSLQLSSKLFDELTLDIIRALGELCRKSTGSLVDADCCEAPGQQTKKRKLSVNDRNVETRYLNMVSTKVRGKRALPETLAGRKSEKSGTEVTSEEKCADADEINKISPGRESTGDKPGDSGGRSFHRPFEPPYWDLQLALMVELTVKHLRGSSLSRKAFEGALQSYWGHFIMDTEEPVMERLEFDRAREEVKNELMKVHSNLDLLEQITQKYTEERVESMLASFLRNSWEETDPSFLERVSSDVVNGIYEPVNPDVPRGAKVGVAGEDPFGENRKGHTTEKPWVRATRGKYSRSREKLRKTFGMLEINATREVENEEKTLPAKLVDYSDTERSVEILESTGGRDVSGSPVHPNRTDEETISISSRTTIDRNSKKGCLPSESREVDTSEREANDFDEEETGRSQAFDKVQLGAGAYPGDGKNKSSPGTHALSAGCDVKLINKSTLPCTPKSSGETDSLNGDPCKGKGLSSVVQELSDDPCTKAKSTNTQSANPQMPGNGGAGVGVEVIDLVSPTPQPLAQIEGCSSPPPWLMLNAMNRREFSPDLRKGREAGHVEVDTGNTRVEEANGDSTERSASDINEVERLKTNLRQRQTQPDEDVRDRRKGTVQEPAQVQPSLMLRNSTARTFEWEDEDDITASPPSPPGSRSIAKERSSPRLASRRSSSQIASQRRIRRKWSTEETEVLKNQVFKFGKGRWKFILGNNQALFHGRTEVDLKDKWRNLERSEGLSVRDE